MEGEECEKAVKAAVVEAGYRQIDTAFLYNNHHDVTKALKSIFDSTTIKREDLFITSKISRKSHGYDAAMKEADFILKELELEYLDLLMVHNPKVEGIESDDPKTAEIRKGTYQAIEKLRDYGKVREVGVSKYTVNHLKDLFSYCKYKPVVN